MFILLVVVVVIAYVNVGVGICLVLVVAGHSKYPISIIHVFDMFLDGKTSVNHISSARDSRAEQRNAAITSSTPSG